MDVITAAQKKAVGPFLPTLAQMWEQRRRWWFAHLRGKGNDEAMAAAHAARLHYKLRTDAGLPDLLIKGWEREWDAWFEKKLKFFRA